MSAAAGGGVDVLAFIDELIRQHKALSADAYHVQELPKAEAVRAAVAELISAIRPLASLDLRPDGFDKRPDSQPVYARDNSVITVGDVRRAAAALSNIEGGK